VTALGGYLGRPRAEEQRVVDVVDLDLDVVRLAPLLGVGPVEPDVVGRDEVGPGHDPKLAGQLLVLVLERPVEPEGLVRECAERAYRERGRRASLQQVFPGQRRALRKLVCYVRHGYLLSSVDSPT
jgi:hypothetical protein